jgi:hypothetical protein
VVTVEVDTTKDTYRHTLTRGENESREEFLERIAAAIDELMGA